MKIQWPLFYNIINVVPRWSPPAITDAGAAVAAAVDVYDKSRYVPRANISPLARSYAPQLGRLFISRQFHYYSFVFLLFGRPIGAKNILNGQRRRTTKGSSAEIKDS